MAEPLLLMNLLASEKLPIAAVEAILKAKRQTERS